MSKTVEWSISPRQKKGMIKMTGLLLNMIQDHDVQADYIITQQEWSLREIHTQVVRLIKRGTYDKQEQEFLNQVRNLVLSYQSGELKENYSQPWDI